MIYLKNDKHYRTTGQHKACGEWKEKGFFVAQLCLQSSVLSMYQLTEI